jgi:simple sugar transport system ATP-binding protein
MTAQQANAAKGALKLDAVGMTKRFGAFTALDDVSLTVAPGSVHALLGENGAGKSTIVKCVMGYYTPTAGQVMVDDREVEIANPRDAHKLGIGMVYQHFTLVPSLTVAENLVLSRGEIPAVVDWRRERAALAAFMARMPFQVPLDRPAGGLAAGEKQKLEILKQLYLDRRFLILDEPTSVLTPDEADEVLGFLRDLARAGTISILLITHKFREVMAFADQVSILRRGRKVGGGAVAALDPQQMAAMMVGAERIAAAAQRDARAPGAVRLEIGDLAADNDAGRPAVRDLSLAVRGGEILGIAGVSGNGQSELVQVLAGQRAGRGTIKVGAADYAPTRERIRALKVFCLAEEPLRNACAPDMSVAENLALRRFDQPPMASGVWLHRGALRARARDLIARYGIKTRSPDSPIATLSGGNVQRAVLARELSEDIDVLIVANPCFGLDFAAVAEIRSQIMAARNRGAAVLLVSEDLDELLELADRIAVMSEGRLVYETPIAAADVATIGRHMAGH